MKRFRKSTFFEKILLFIGIAIGFIGFFIINNLFAYDHAMSWSMIQAVFLWLILIITIVLIAIGEDVKEELAIILRELTEETKLLKEIDNDQLKEIKLLRDAQLKELRLLREDLKRR